MPCKNYSNPYSLTTAPKSANVEETVPIDSVDTCDWRIDPETKGLVCKNAGTWNILAQYQVVNINPKDDAAEAQIDGWFIVNGNNVPYSDAASNANMLNSKNVLAIGAVIEFKKDDVLEFGIASFTKDGSLNVDVNGFSTNRDITFAPSLIITASKVSSP